MSIVLQSSGGGQITLQEPATASNFTQTLPAASGEVMVSGNQPAFSVYLNANQNISNATFTKVQLNVEEFDTANAFDVTTNYRFQPLIAGYYQINGSISYENGVSSIARYIASIYKNNSEYKRGVDSTSNGNIASVSSIVYLNGSTDYVELYGYASGTNLRFSQNGTFNTWFNGVMVRAA